MTIVTAEILRPNAQSFDGARRVGNTRGEPIVVIDGVDVVPAAVQVGKHWFVLGNSREARLLDQLKEKAKA